MGPRARSTSAQGRESKHSRIYVRLYLPTCPSPVRFVVPREARLYASLLAKYFASTWQKRNRSFTLSRIPVSRVFHRIAYRSLSLRIYVSIYLFLRASLRTESNLYHLNFSPRVNSHFFLRKCDCFIVISLSCNFYIFTRISHVGIDIIFWYINGKSIEIIIGGNLSDPSRFIYQKLDRIQMKPYRRCYRYSIWIVVRSSSIVVRFLYRNNFYFILFTYFYTN